MENVADSKAARDLRNLVVVVLGDHHLNNQLRRSFGEGRVEEEEGFFVRFELIWIGG